MIKEERERSKTIAVVTVPDRSAAAHGKNSTESSMTMSSAVRGVPIDYRCLSSAQVQAAAALFRSSSDMTYIDIREMLEELPLSLPGPGFDIKRVLASVGILRPGDLTCDGFLHLVAAVWTSLERMTTHEAHVKHAYEAIQLEKQRLEAALFDSEGSQAVYQDNISLSGSIAHFGSDASGERELAAPTRTSSPRANSGGGGGALLPRPSFIAPREQFCEDAVAAIVSSNSSRNYRNFQSFMAPPEADAKLLSAFKSLGATDTGVGYYVDCEQFVRSCLKKGFSSSDARQIFKFFDDDGSGEIDFEEFRRILNLDLSSLGVTPVVLEGLMSIMKSMERRATNSISGWLGPEGPHESLLGSEFGGGGDHDTLLEGSSGENTVTLLDRLNQKSGDDANDANATNHAPLHLLEKLESQLETITSFVDTRMRMHEDNAHRIQRNKSLILSASVYGCPSMEDTTSSSSRRGSQHLALIPAPPPPTPGRGRVAPYVYGVPPPPSREGRRVRARIQGNRRPLHVVTDVEQLVVSAHMARERAVANIGLPPIIAHATTPALAKRADVRCDSADGIDWSGDQRRQASIRRPKWLNSQLAQREGANGAQGEEVEEEFIEDPDGPDNTTTAEGQQPRPPTQPTHNLDMQTLLTRTLTYPLGNSTATTSSNKNKSSSPGRSRRLLLQSPRGEDGEAESNENLSSSSSPRQRGEGASSLLSGRQLPQLPVGIVSSLRNAEFNRLKNEEQLARKGMLAGQYCVSPRVMECQRTAIRTYLQPL
jgi:Ca2+-binding EF-hand superfamily protein